MTTLSLQPNRSDPNSGRITTTDLSLALLVMIWGVNFTIIKATLEQFGPLAFTAIRFVLATAVSIVALTTMKQSLRPATSRDFWQLLLLGLLGHATYQLLSISGLNLSTASTTSLILASVPIWIALISSLLGLEQVSKSWWGILLAFGGLVALVTGKEGFHLRSSSAIGDGLIVLAAWSWAAYTVAQKPLLSRYSPLQISTITMLVGTVPLLLIGTPQLLNQQWQSVTWQAWAGLVFSAVGGLALAYLIWSTAVQRIGNARTAVYSNGVPVVATITAWLVLGETLTPVQVVGAAVVVLGIWLTRRLR